MYLSYNIITIGLRPKLVKIYNLLLAFDKHIVMLKL